MTGSYVASARGGLRDSAAVPAAEILPFATRVWCVRDRERQSKRSRRRKPSWRPDRFLALRVVKVGDGIPAATLGVARSGYIRGADWEANREIWFYGPATPPDQITALSDFISANTMPRPCKPSTAEGAGKSAEAAWRDEIGAKVVGPIALDEFLRKVFYPMARDDKALIVGHDLLCTLGALAARWGRAKRHKVKKKMAAGEPAPDFRRNVWSLELRAEDFDPATGAAYPDARWHNRIIVTPFGDEAVGVSLGTLKRKGRQPKGDFLDLAQLGNGLTGGKRTFAEEVAAFTGIEIDEADPSPFGMREISRALVSLAGAMVGYFDLLHAGLSRASGGPLAETKVFGSGSIARAYAMAAGSAPAPKVKPEMVGFCAEANHGGWFGIGLRGRAPVVETDFRRQYATVFTRQGIGDLLAGRRLDFVEATEEIRTLAESGPVEIGPHLNAFCLIHWRGEPAMVKAAFRNLEERDPEPEDFSLAMAPRWSDGPVPSTLADAIAARVLCGRAPEIVEGWKIVARDPRRLRKIEVLGRRIDPAKVPIPQALAEQSVQIERDEERFSEPLRKLLANGAKKIGNIFSYGMLIEAREVDLPAGKRGEPGTEEVALLHGSGSIRRRVQMPEEDGPMTCVPLGCLVAASGRLLLARMHRAVADRGGVMACWDTDSGHIVATEHGGKVTIETRGADWRAPLRRERIKALPWAEVDEIVAGFEAEGLLPGSALRVTDENFDPESGERVPLEGLYLAAKRYRLTAPGGRLASAMETLIGNPLPPLRNGFTAAAWRMIDAAWSGSPARQAEMRPVWLQSPVVCEMTVSAPDHAFELQGLDGNRKRIGPAALDLVYPGMRYLVAQATGRRPNGEMGETRRIVAPFCDDPEAWESLPWRFLAGADFAPGVVDDDGFCWDFERWRGLMDHFLLMRSPAMLGPDGQPASGWTCGLLRSRPVCDGRHYYLLKERFGWGAGPDEGFDRGLVEMFEGDPKPDAEPEPDLGDKAWDDVIRPALAIVETADVAARSHVAERTVQAWVAGERRPEEPTTIATAVVAIARDLGLGSGDDDLACCRALPAQLVRAHQFNAMAAVAIGARHGGLDGLAAALGISKAAVYREIGKGDDASATETKPVMTFLARLGRLARAEVRSRCVASAQATDRKPKLPMFEEGPPGDRVACVALLSLYCGAARPVIKPAEWSLGLPELVAEMASPGAANARLAALDARPSGWLALMGAMARALGIAATVDPLGQWPGMAQRPCSRGLKPCGRGPNDTGTSRLGRPCSVPAIPTGRAFS